MYGLPVAQQKRCTAFGQGSFAIHRSRLSLVEEDVVLGEIGRDV